MRAKAGLIMTTLLSVAALVPCEAHAADVIYAASQLSSSLFAVDPDTGNRTIVSGSTVGTGPLLIGIRGIAVETSGSVVVTSEPTQSVTRVDPATGNRTLVSHSSIGTGPNFVNPRHISVDGDGSLLVSDFGFTGLLRVDPVTGDRTVVSSNPFASPEVGSGPTITYWRNSEPEAAGSIVVSDFYAYAVLRIDPATGNRTVLSDDTHGSGPTFSDVRAGLVVDPGGDILVTDNVVNGVVRVDPVSGDRSIVTNNSTGSGPTFVGDLYDIDFLSDDTILVTDSYPELGFPTDPCLAAIVAVDPVTGDRAVLSSNSLGTGDPFPIAGVQFIAVDRGGEPGPTAARLFELWR